MKAKKIYYSIVVGLQSLFILLLFVNIGYCIITSDLTMFPTTALYLNFYPFMNFFKTHNPYDLLVFISLLLLLFAMHFATIYILFKKVKRIYAWVVIVNAYMYALTLYSNGDLIYVLKYDEPISWKVTLYKANKSSVPLLTDIVTPEA